MVYGYLSIPGSDRTRSPSLPGWLVQPLSRPRIVYLPIIFAVFFVSSLFIIPSPWLQDQHERIQALVTSSVSQYSSRGCPSPWNPILPVNRPLQIDDRNCQPLLTGNDTKFDVSLCANPVACNSFKIRISRNDKTECERMETRIDMSDDPSVLRFLKEEQGPDTFHFRISGAQRFASELPRYNGQCEYDFDVSLSTGGDIWMELWHQYENYDAFAPLAKVDFVPSLGVQLFAEPIHIDACPSRCPRYYAPHLLDKVTPSFSTASGAPATGISFEGDHLPPCGDAAPLAGIYLPWHPMDVAHPPASIIRPNDLYDPVMGQYRFVPTACNLRHGGNQFNFDHSSCTSKPHSVVWTGDSHMRFLIHSWQYRMAGHRDFYPLKDKWVSDKSVAVDGQLSNTFVWSPTPNMVAEQLTIEEIDKFDAVVYSSGSWDGMYGNDPATSLAKFEETIKLLEGTPGRPEVHRVYVTPAPFPPMPAPNHRERRTNIWLAYWSREARRIAQRRGWKIIDQFDIGMPLLREMLSADGLHLSPSDIHATLVDDVLAKTGTC